MPISAVTPDETQNPAQEGQRAAHHESRFDMIIVRRYVEMQRRQGLGSGIVARAAGNRAMEGMGHEAHHREDDGDIAVMSQQVVHSIQP